MVLEPFYGFGSLLLFVVCGGMVCGGRCAADGATARMLLFLVAARRIAASCGRSSRRIAATTRVPSRLRSTASGNWRSRRGTGQVSLRLGPCGQAPSGHAGQRGQGGRARACSWEAEEHPRPRSEEKTIAWEACPDAISGAPRGRGPSASGKLSSIPGSGASAAALAAGGPAPISPSPCRRGRARPRRPPDFQEAEQHPRQRRISGCAAPMHKDQSSRSMCMYSGATQSSRS